MPDLPGHAARRHAAATRRPGEERRRRHRLDLAKLYRRAGFPHTEALELPFLMPTTGLAGSKAMWEYYTKFATKDFADFKMLAMFSGTRRDLQHVVEAHRRAGQLQGRQAAQPLAQCRQAAHRVRRHPGQHATRADHRSDRQRRGRRRHGPCELVPAVKLEEVAKFHAEGPADQPGFTANPLVMLMNKQKYDGLRAGPEGRARQEQRPGAGRIGRQCLGRVDGDARKTASAAATSSLRSRTRTTRRCARPPPRIEQDWAGEVAGKGVDGRQARHRCTRHRRQVHEVTFAAPGLQAMNELAAPQTPRLVPLAGSLRRRWMYARELLRDGRRLDLRAH